MNNKFNVYCKILGDFIQSLDEGIEDLELSGLHHEDGYKKLKHLHKNLVWRNNLKDTDRNLFDRLSDEKCISGTDSEGCHTMPDGEGISNTPSMHSLKEDKIINVSTDEQNFWCVWRRDTQGTSPSLRHGDKASAVVEASRLAIKTGASFYILETIDIVSAVPPIEPMREFIEFQNDILCRIRRYQKKMIDSDPSNARLIFGESNEQPVGTD